MMVTFWQKCSTLYQSVKKENKELFSERRRTLKEKKGVCKTALNDIFGMIVCETACFFFSLRRALHF